MYPFTQNHDHLQLYSSQTWEGEGENYKNIRSEWYNLDNIETEDIFTSINTGVAVSGKWFQDGGDGSLASEKREKRIYCRKGKATFKCTGSSIVLRVYVNPLYGKADVRIDGVLPSAMAHGNQQRDVASCDKNDFDGSWGEEYIDLTLGNNMEPIEHTVELYMENDDSGVGGWFCIAGYKTNLYTNKTRYFDCYITPYKIPANKETLSFYNSCDDYDDDYWPESICDLAVYFDDYFVDILGNKMGWVTSEEILLNTGSYIDFYPDVQGSESEGQENKTIEVYADYEDLNGAIQRGPGYQEIYAFYEDQYKTFGDWIMEWKLFSPTLYVFIARSYNTGGYLEFTFFGTNVYVETINEGYGTFAVYVDNILRSPSWTENYGGLYKSRFDGFANRSHTVRLEINSPWGWVYFHRIYWTEYKYYTRVHETLTYNYNLEHIPPLPPVGPRFETANSRYPTCNVVDLDAYDYNIPRVNAGVDMLYLDQRVATFAVCYQAGSEKILKTYDIVIVEPKALTRTIVKEYQALGIKVICYCSYGEELGTYENEWDITSNTVPHTGDGQGVGGYASYYNKGGNQFGECSECKHDKRRLEDVAECALNQTSFYAVWAGRCSNACTKDWRTGYETYILGWNCGGGHNSSGHWSRTATKACTNSTCPDYNAVKGACPYYESPDENMYGQDYSIFTSDWPDENGIWKSFYTNPRESAWSERLKDHYLSTIFNEGVKYTETVSANTFPTDNEWITVSGFKVEHTPIDCDEYVGVKHVGTGHIFARGIDYIFDSELGTFKMQVSIEGSPAAEWGTQLEVTYTRKGLKADGIFLDTLDTVDVYTSEEYQTAMVDIIGEHHALYPDKIWAMNRGFTILEDLMPFTDYVMFETFVTSYNWDTGVYYEITDPAAIAANQVFIDQLFNLRDTYEFNVLGLNYCGKSDDALKQLITEKTRQYGWLSWSSEISLNDPQENEETFTKGLYIESNAWRLTRELSLP